MATPQQPPGGRWSALVLVMLLVSTCLFAQNDPVSRSWNAPVEPFRIAGNPRGGLDDPQFGNRFPFPPVMADRIIDDGARVSLGGVTLVAHITPGHTPGCTTWTTRIGKRDVVFVGSPTVPSEYRLTGNPRYPNAIEDYRAQFRRLKSLGCDIFLASHGNFYGLQEMIEGRKSFAGCDAYHVFVERSERRFEDRVKRGE